MSPKVARLGPIGMPAPCPLSRVTETFSGECRRAEISSSASPRNWVRRRSSIRPGATGRQRYFKNRPVRLTEGHRQMPSMTCYNRPTDRQPHAHTVRFRRKERVEDAIDVFWNDPNSRVLHCNQQEIGFKYFSPEPQSPLAICHSAHCVNGIRNQVHDNLSQLGAIGSNSRKFVE
jgi:hypothetical protein